MIETKLQNILPDSYSRTYDRMELMPFLFFLAAIPADQAKYGKYDNDSQELKKYGSPGHLVPVSADFLMSLSPGTSVRSGWG
jgi:hypothetical protein